MKNRNMSHHNYRKLAEKIMNKPILYIVLLLVVVATYILGSSGKIPFLSSLFDPTAVESPNTCEVHYIDVGQGDCALLLTDSGTVLIDAGTTESGNSAAAYIRNRTKTIDYMILTHPHEDHIGGASYIMDEIEVKNIIMPDMTADTASFDRLLDSIEKNGTKVIKGEKGLGFLAGDIRIELLSPAPTANYEDANNMSIVSRISYKDSSFLFTGDAEKIVEDDLLRSGQKLRSDVLKVGHHGSSTSTSKDFLKAVSPEFAVISCGKDNKYGHPHHEIKTLLEKQNIPTFRTDKDGTVVLVSDGKKIYVK